MHRSSSQARPLLAGISVVVALSVLVAGCGLIGGSTGRPVTVVGDSLSVLGTSEIRDVLRSAGWRPSVDAYPGVTVAASMDGLTKAAKKLDRPIVIELEPTTPMPWPRARRMLGPRNARLTRRWISSPAASVWCG